MSSLLTFPMPTEQQARLSPTIQLFSRPEYKCLVEDVQRLWREYGHMRASSLENSQFCKRFGYVQGFSLEFYRWYSSWYYEDYHPKSQQRYAAEFQQLFPHNYPILLAEMHRDGFIEYQAGYSDGEQDGFLHGASGHYRQHEMQLSVEYGQQSLMNDASVNRHYLYTPPTGVGATSPGTEAYPTSNPDAYQTSGMMMGQKLPEWPKAQDESVRPSDDGTHVYDDDRFQSYPQTGVSAFDANLNFVGQEGVHEAVDGIPEGGASWEDSEHTGNEALPAPFLESPKDVYEHGKGSPQNAENAQSTGSRDSAPAWAESPLAIGPVQVCRSSLLPSLF